MAKEEYDFAKSVVEMSDEDLSDELTRYIFPSDGKFAYLFEAIRRLLER